ncbi:PREDICTED: jacalin-related lectin 9 [Camelina sativa]|uniref:Jacalin-related lectin 9 n=1 Tax=Camelina sativa TaxID=90675 RepID=A0ABM0X2N9_CAMSA|nr:PREDICTED: jacalin-related lectin 9 [Camelina sativa]
MVIIYIFLFLSSAFLDSNGFATAQKLDAIGGKGGKLWDDGRDHDNVAKVYIRGGLEGIQYIKFDYVKSGQSIDGSIHGVLGNGFTHMFDIDYQNGEHIVSVDGYYDKSGVMQALEIKTNKKTSEVIGYPKGNTKFSLGGVSGKMITGFHGSADKALNSIGAYFTKVPPTKSELVGGWGGEYWDDGPNYDGVRKISVTFISTVIRSIDTDYEKDGQVVTSHHGNKEGETQEFVIDYPNEYLTSVEGTHNYILFPDHYVLVITSLSFKTSKGRVSPTYGVVSGTKFVLESQGNAIVGFHGRDGGAFDAIGVYFSPI